MKVIVDQFLGGQGTCGILGVRRKKGSDMGVFNISLKTFKSLGTEHYDFIIRKNRLKISGNS